MHLVPELPHCHDPDEFFGFRQTKQKSFLHAGQFICLQASVCCTNAPQRGHALKDGVVTPFISLLPQLCSICIRGSPPPLCRITTTIVDECFILAGGSIIFTLKLFCVSKFIVPTVNRSCSSLTLSSLVVFALISFMRSLIVAVYNIKQMNIKGLTY